MKIYITPTRKFLKDFPEYEKLPCLFLGWSTKVNSVWGFGQIRVKFGNRRIEFIDVGHFKDLIIK